MMKILVVDDNEGMRHMLAESLGALGYEVTVAADGKAALKQFKREAYRMVLVDVRMPGMSGLEVLAALKRLDGECLVIVMTAYGTVDNAVEAMKAGAYDYLTKPFTIDQLDMIIKRAGERLRLARENVYYREELERLEAGEVWVGKSRSMRELDKMVRKVAGTDTNVIIYGESGTGKELVANALHLASKRRMGPMVRVSCATFVETLLESELFGHEKGAFTGATSRRVGRFELADGGTIFLDEIGDVSVAVQTKLLRVLQEKEFERVGGMTPIRVDARVIAATNRDLKQAVKDGSFREDLFFRLNVMPLDVPPLRQRPEDIPLLARHFLEKYTPRGEKKKITPAALEALRKYRWPGNVRELENVIQRGIIVSEGEKITPDALPLELAERKEERTAKHEGGFAGKVEEYERDLIADALRRARGVRSQAAKLLGINRTALLYKIKKYKL